MSKAKKIEKIKARFLAGFFLLILASSSQYLSAQENKVNTVEFRRNYLYHLSFVLPDHYLTESSFVYGRTTGELNGLSTSVSKIEFKEEFRTGITDNVELNVNWAYLISETSETLANKVKSSGPREFILGFRYRYLVLDEDDNYNLDLFFRLTPDFANARLATAVNNGNGFAGQTVFEIEAVLGRREQKSEFSFHGSLAYLGKESVVNDDLGLKFRSNLSYMAKVFFVMQPRLKLGHYLKGMVGARKRGDRKIFTLKQREDVSFFGEIGYTYKITSELAVGLQFNWFERNGKEYSGVSELAINQHIFSTAFNVIYLIY